MHHANSCLHQNSIKRISILTAAIAKYLKSVSCVRPLPTHSTGWCWCLNWFDDFFCNRCTTRLLLTLVMHFFCNDRQKGPSETAITYRRTRNEKSFEAKLEKDDWEVKIGTHKHKSVNTAFPSRVSTLGHNMHAKLIFPCTWSEQTERLSSLLMMMVGRTNPHK